MDTIFEMNLLCMEQDLTPAIEADVGGTIRRIVNTVFTAVMNAFHAVASFAHNCYKTFKTKIAQLRKKKESKPDKSESENDESQLSSVHRELEDALDYVNTNVAKYLTDTQSYAQKIIRILGDSAQGKAIDDELIQTITERHEDLAKNGVDAIDGIKRLSDAVDEYIKHPLYTTEMIKKMDKINDLFNNIYQSYDGAVAVIQMTINNINKQADRGNEQRDEDTAVANASLCNRLGAYLEKDIGIAKKVIVAFGAAFKKLLQSNPTK